MADKMAVSALLLLCTVTLSSVNSCLSLREVYCLHALMNETLLQPFNVFY
jgi:hypothetical protein